MAQADAGDFASKDLDVAPCAAAAGVPVTVVGVCPVYTRRWLIQDPLPSGELFMKRLLLSALVLGAGAAFCSAADFEPPVRLKAGDAAIRVESPGYAAPCWADINGKKQLLVGQFNQGKIRTF